MNQTRRPVSNPQQRMYSGLEKLLQPGVLGHYEWFEVIEVGCFDGTVFLNVFSIYVAVENVPSELQSQPAFLNGSDRRINGVPKRSFGVVRRYISAEALLQAATQFDAEGTWQSHATPLLHGDLKAVAPAFYAVDGTHRVPLNRVLKNNFWNGSYVIELADATKNSLRFLTGNPDCIEALGTWVKKFAKIDLSLIPDRLGNVIIQLPVNCISTKFSGSKENTIDVTVAWHPDVIPRRISGSVQLVFDEAIVAYGQQELVEGSNSIVADISNRPFKGVVWDLDKNIILAAHPATTFFRAGGFRGTMSSVGESARIFYDVNTKGEKIRKEVPLVSIQETWSQGEKSTRPNGDWTEKRISDSEIKELVRLKRFVQYGGTASGEMEHERALLDIRELINMHGEDAVYLWDPYLSSADLLTTLFYCKHRGANLKAITSSKVFERKEQEKCKVCDTPREPLTELTTKESEFTARQRWVKDQQDLLSDSVEGVPHINLEFKISYGPKGWSFHDRFLIFPKGNDYGPEVWSLGASVNHLGSVHAIVQQVAHPQPVIDAFDTLWMHLDTDEHLVWASPK